MTDQYSILNRNGLTMQVTERRVADPKGTAIIHHGYPGAAHSPTIVRMADAFNQLGLNAISPDTTHNYNKSDGDYQNMSLAQHCDDLEDCVKFVCDSAAFSGPLVIAGHSAGGYSALVVSARIDPAYRPALTIASAPVISGRRFIKSWEEILPPDIMNMWRARSFIPVGSDAGPDELKLRWTVMKEWRKHDLIRDKIRPANPTILISGKNDDFIKPGDVKDYADSVSLKSVKFIPKANHSYDGQEAKFTQTIINAVTRTLSL